MPLTCPPATPPARCQLIKIDAKYAKSRENPRGKFSTFSQLISPERERETHARSNGSGKCDWLLLFAYALLLSSRSSPLFLSCLQCAWHYGHAPPHPHPACFFSVLGLFAFAYHRRMSRGIATQLSQLSWLAWLAGDNNNSSELRAGWEMPLICSSCQLSRSEIKWKSHALMADEAGRASRTHFPFLDPASLLLLLLIPSLH